MSIRVYIIIIKNSNSKKIYIYNKLYNLKIYYITCLYLDKYNIIFKKLFLINKNN